ncbi:MAG: hypothetical protein RL094_715 [Candidatus Parcubacteria bacterium]|jgi:thiosulfate dehydrogenase [quinone] large subunit
MNQLQKMIALLRVLMGAMFLWAFVDKVFGFGFATTSSQAWIHGGSPTDGFLAHATHGPLAFVFQSMAGSSIVAILFMSGLLFVGVTMLTNKFVKWGTYAGIAMMALIYLSMFPPANNPLIDEHIIYIAVFMLIAANNKSSIASNS